MPRCALIFFLILSCMLAVYLLSLQRSARPLSSPVTAEPFFNLTSSATMPFRAETSKLSYSYPALKTKIYKDNKILRFSDVLGLWQNDGDFRSFFINLLRQSPFGAYRWETPPVTKSSVNREFEFVILEDKWLDTPTDLSSFSDYINRKNQLVVSFPNLGKDGLMTAPTLQSDSTNYAHLGAFIRGASQEQKDALWKTVGEQMTKKVDTRPVWLSTAGGGVAYLHVRIDSWPKYYAYEPYKKKPDA